MLLANAYNVCFCVVISCHYVCISVSGVMYDVSVAHRLRNANVVLVVRVRCLHLVDAVFLYRICVVFYFVYGVLFVIMWF